MRVLFLLSFWVMKNIWNDYVKTDTQYENWLLWIAFPAFTVIYLITAYYAGLYDRWYKRSELIRSTSDCHYCYTGRIFFVARRVSFFKRNSSFRGHACFYTDQLATMDVDKIQMCWQAVKTEDKHSNTLIVGSAEEYKEVIQLMKDAGLQEKVIGRVAVNENDKGGHRLLVGNRDVIQSVPFREIIFCEGTLSFKNIIEGLHELEKM